jgi:hypothetical protein
MGKWKVTIIAATLLIIMAGTAAAKQDNDGFIYGTVTMESGKEYEGFLRWNTDEEAFWDDLFHSSKEDLPYLDQVDRRDRHGDKRRKTVKIFGIRVNVESDDWGSSSSRIFISRFGDIAELQVRGSNSARLLMKSGESYEVEGYANDVGATIRVLDANLGEIDLRWNRIESIRFAGAPRKADPGVTRLYGKLSTRRGEFEGFIQWDKEECLSSDELDGDTEDGDVSIPMGSIVSIERRGSRSCEVALKDGRSFRLRGSNDVNSDNRGIMVEDERFGRVVVFWNDFDRLDFSDAGSSGRAYKDYGKGGWLTGKVTDDGGEAREGRIVFDLDETETWEILNGDNRDIEYNIPFSLIRSIEPGRHESKVILAGGEELWLESSQDVTESNDGLLVFDHGDDDPFYLNWRRIEKIELNR